MGMVRPGAKEGERRMNFVGLWTISQFGWQVAVCILLGLGIDHYFNSSPWGTLICSLIGLVTAILTLIRMGLDSARQVRSQQGQPSSKPGSSSQDPSP